jgi:hypothetical protein
MPVPGISAAIGKQKFFKLGKKSFHLLTVESAG